MRRLRPGWADRHHRTAPRTEPAERDTAIETEYEATVQEVYKGTVPNVIRILKRGGEKEYADRIVRELAPASPAFKPGETYVLFLAPLRQGAAFRVVHFQEGAFRIVGDEVQAVGTHQLARAQNRRSAKAFGDELRLKGKGR